VSFVAALALVPLGGVASAQAGGSPLADGFNGPQGILVDADGNVWVIDSGLGGDQELTSIDTATGQATTASFGETAQVVRIAPDGSKTVAAMLPSILSGQEAMGGARLALLNGSLYATSGGWLEVSGEEAAPKMAAVVKIEDGQATQVAGFWPLERDQNPDGFILESHPYGLTAGPDGMLWVTDAGGNSLFKVDPASGDIQLVTAFKAGVPSPLPNPNRDNAMESDPVPTAIAFDAAGNGYVSFLPGFPFLPGSAKVVKVTADGQVSDYATGLTSITDLRTGPDGEMYAVQFAQFNEQGPTPNSGAIVRVKAGDASEVLLSGLSFPTSIDFAPNGDAYVTINGVGAPGSGAVVTFAGLTGMEVVSAAQPAQLPTTGGESLPVGWFIVGAGFVLAAAGLLLARRTAGVWSRNEE
jgi:sugar lactone lactonase YvrE